jgi:hypothetical protein
MDYSSLSCVNLRALCRGRDLRTARSKVEMIAILERNDAFKREEIMTKLKREATKEVYAEIGTRVDAFINFDEASRDSCVDTDDSDQECGCSSPDYTHAGHEERSVNRKRVRAYEKLSTEGPNVPNLIQERLWKKFAEQAT